MTSEWDDDAPGRDTIEMARDFRKQVKNKMEHAAPEGAQARMQQMLRDNMDALASRMDAMTSSGKDEDGDIKARGFKLLDGVQSRDGTIGIIAVVLIGYFLFSDYREGERMDARMAEFEATQRGIIKAQGSAAALLVKIDGGVNPPPPPASWYRNRFETGPLEPKRGTQSD